MKKVIYKLFWIWQYDKQEEWLNKMAGEGWALTAIGLGRYDLKNVHRENIKSGLNS